MPRKANITINEHTIIADLKNTPTAESIYAVLPFESKAQTWGDEIYFATPVFNQGLENSAKDVVELGELAFWVEGNCIAIGFGPTPISRGGEIRLTTHTNIWVHTDYDLTTLKNVCSGDVIYVSAA